MAAIFKREFKAYFHSIIGFLFIAATLFFISIYFTVYNLVYGYPYISYALQSVMFLFMISVPVLTMRVLAEDRKNKTDQLILTAPVSVFEIVFGKFLALVTIFAIPVAVTCIYPVIMSRFGTISFAMSYLSILGFFLYGVTCIAVGVFVSSITESQVIAAVISFAILFICYMMDGLCGLISETGNILTKILRVLDMGSRFTEFVSGTFSIPAVIYFITISAFFIFLTCQMVQKRRYSVSTKAWRNGAYNSSMIVLVLIITVMINLVAGVLPASIKTIDMTEGKLYSITDTTKELLQSLDQDINVYVLSTQEGCDTVLEKTLTHYEDTSSHIHVSYIDPTLNPTFYQTYTSTAPTANSMIVATDEKSVVIDYYDIYEYTINSSTYSYEASGYDGEGQLTSAINSVISDDSPKVYTIEGHGETALSDSFLNAITKENAQQESINLIKYDSIPEDAACIIINAPTTDITEEEYTKISAYLEAGGSAILTATKTEGETPNYDALFARYGILLTGDYVVEDNSQYYSGYPSYMLPDFGLSSLTDNLSNYVFTPNAIGMTIAESAAEDASLDITEILLTSQDAHTLYEYEGRTSYSLDAMDEEGPFYLGMDVTKTEDDETTSRVIAFSTAYIFTDDANSYVSGANLQLFSNAISTLAGHELTSAVAVKDYTVSYLTLTQANVVLIGVLTILVIPLSLLIAGLIIWLRRRKNK